MLKRTFTKKPEEEGGRRIQGRSFRRATATLLLSLAGCSGGAGGSGASAAAQSAGLGAAGTAMRLVEELSIGQETGAEAQLFGSITSAWATQQRIYLVDAQVPAVRAFDRAGTHLFDIGRPGQGPGEFNQPAGVVVRGDGRIAVADLMNARINWYDGEGEFVEDWPLSSPKSALGLALTFDDELLTQSWDNTSGRMGMRPIGPDGPRGEHLFPPQIDFAPPTVAIGAGSEMILPFAPAYAWAFAPGGEMVAGVGDAYDFDVVRADGEALRLGRDTPPVPVTRAEAAFRAEIASTALRFMAPDATVVASDIPATKPFFSGFFADRAGRVWVIRPGPGRVDAYCDDLNRLAAPRMMMRTEVGTSFEAGGKSAPIDPDSLAADCWTDTVFFDLFELADGDFIGTVEAPEIGFLTPLFADESTVLAAVTDENGTVRLKRYRLEETG